MNFNKCLLFLLFFYGCNNAKTNTININDSSQNNRALIPTYKTLLPNEKFDSIVFAFIKAKPCDSCLYEMYVDERYPDDILVTLKKRVYNAEYIKKHSNSLFTINYGDKQFFVYSGLESVFIGDKKSIIYDKDANNGVFVKWEIFIDSNNYKVDTAFEGFPFFPLPQPIKFRKNFKWPLK